MGLERSKNMAFHRIHSAANCILDARDAGEDENKALAKWEEENGKITVNERVKIYNLVFLILEEYEDDDYHRGMSRKPYREMKHDY